MTGCLNQKIERLRVVKYSGDIFCLITPSKCHNLLPKSPNSPIVHIIYWLNLLEEQRAVKEGDKMNKQNMIQKVWEVIQEALPVSDGTTNKDSGLVDSMAAILTDDTEDEQAIRDLSRDFAQALTDRDFEHLDSRAEYHFYTLDHLIDLIKNSDEQSTIKLFNDNKIKSKYEDCEFLSITFSANLEQAVVVYNVRTCVVSAEGKYFKELNKKGNEKNKISDGTPFGTTYTLTVKKERGICKIDKFEASEANIRMSTEL